MKKYKLTKLGLITTLLTSLLFFISGCVPSAAGGEGGFDPSIIIIMVLNCTLELT